MGVVHGNFDFVEEVILNLVIASVFGGITAFMASNKGRNTLGWFFIGFFFPCLGIVLIMCLSDLNEEQARIDGQNAKTRRLREQLRQEKLKNESAHQQVAGRLDRHDEALGIDTRPSAVPQVEGPPPRPRLSSDIPPVDSRSWYYATDDEELGPITQADLKRKRSIGEVDDQTMVWTQGMSNWMHLGDIPELRIDDDGSAL